MNVLASECSSGCESGWTLYLEQSFLSPTHRDLKRGDTKKFIGPNNNVLGDIKQSNVLYNEEEQEHEEDDDDNDSDDEDLSMVSDASSGPPHFHEEHCDSNVHECCFNNGHNCYYNNSDNYNSNNGCSYLVKDATLVKNGVKRTKLKENRVSGQNQELLSLLDETASSPAFTFSQSDFGVTCNQDSMSSMLDYSQGFSATNFEGRSAYQEQYGYLQPSGNQIQKNQWF